MLEILTSVLYTILIVNYLASAGTEALSSTFKWRPRLLYNNVRTILNDDVTGLAVEVYRNALIHPRSSGDEDSPSFLSNLPSYIDPNYFAKAFIAILGLEQKNLDELKGKPIREIEAWIEQNIQPLRNDRQLRRLVADILDAHSGDYDGILAGFASWFSQASDRISGAYKRRTQISNVSIAFVLAVTFDLNPLPPAIAALSQATSAAAGAITAPAPAPAPAPGPSAPPPASVASAAAAAAMKPTAAGPSPAGGQATGVQGNMRNARRIADRMLGWVITALSTLLGAPFWFSLLSRVANIRGSGGSPPTPQAAGTPPASPPSAPSSPPGPSSAPPPAGPPPTPPNSGDASPPGSSSAGTSPMPPSPAPPDGSPKPA